mmetsp:Transcript_22766/g.49304  ORF Transcript_22766/g.49304 Transcript_22766/m.49304 type:complete len:96 (-) Transcript_22766:555-842(-)
MILNVDVSTPTTQDSKCPYNFVCSQALQHLFLVPWYRLMNDTHPRIEECNMYKIAISSCNALYLSFTCQSKNHVYFKTSAKNSYFPLCVRNVARQ